MPRTGAPTVADLVDYLQQFPPDTPVYLDDESLPDSDATGGYVSLSFALDEMEAQR